VIIYRCAATSGKQTSHRHCRRQLSTTGGQLVITSAHAYCQCALKNSRNSNIINRDYAKHAFCDAGSAVLLVTEWSAGPSQAIVHCMPHCFFGRLPPPASTPATISANALHCSIECCHGVKCFCNHCLSSGDTDSGVRSQKSEMLPLPVVFACTTLRGTCAGAY
jgi:hypothetical protein